MRQNRHLQFVHQSQSNARVKNVCFTAVSAEQLTKNFHSESIYSKYLLCNKNKINVSHDCVYVYLSLVCKSHKHQIAVGNVSYMISCFHVDIETGSKGWQMAWMSLKCLCVSIGHRTEQTVHYLILGYLISCTELNEVLQLWTVIQR